VSFAILLSGPATAASKPETYYVQTTTSDTTVTLTTHEGLRAILTGKPGLAGSPILSFSIHPV